MTQRNCRRCQKEFKTVRTAQLYCCRKCRVADAVSRHRSDYTKPRGLAVAEKRLRGLSESPKPLSDDSTLVWAIHAEHHKLTPGALQGDEYQLEYYEDGFPKMPACLDRRSITFAEAA